MEDGYTGDEELSSPMKVRELMAFLEKVNPDFLVVIGADARSLTIVNPRPGFCLRGEEEGELAYFTERDWNFLRDLHIK